MEIQHANIQLKLVVNVGEHTFVGNLLSENPNQGIRISASNIINPYDIRDAAKRFILRNCGDEEILNAIIDNDYDRMELAYNPNLKPEMADTLADELCYIDSMGSYPYNFCVILSNPSLSGEKIDQYARHFVEHYHYLIEINDGKPDYEIIYLLKYIAQNPSAWDSTLEFLKETKIPLVVQAAQR